MNSWALSRLYNTKLRQIQKKKKKEKPCTHIYSKRTFSPFRTAQLEGKRNRNDKDECFSLRGSGSAVIRRGSRGLVQVEMTPEERRAAPSDRDATHRTEFLPEPATTGVNEAVAE